MISHGFEKIKLIFQFFCDIILYCLGVVEAVGSNPATQTNKKEASFKLAFFLYFHNFLKNQKTIKPIRRFRDFIGESFQKWGTKMQYDEIYKHLDLILSMALQKCNNLSDAEDLAQETMLDAISYLASGKIIENPKAYLITVLNRKYYSILRKKYHLPTVTISDGFDILDEENFVDDIMKEEERKNIRKEVAYLSKSYRIIIVKYYFYGKSIKDIANEFGIAEGTVKSRLDFGRKQLKKGIESMKSYVENSYIPQRLIVRNSGRCGLNEEPMSLADDDNLLAQNLLILAYENPISITDLSKQIGVAAAYVEPVINKLVDNELMERMGDGKVYTDFIIYHAEDYVKYIKEEEDFAEKYLSSYCTPIKEAIEELKATNFYSKALERYMMIHVACDGLWSASQKNCPPQIFPERPNGGRWIAFGTIYPENYVIPEDKRGKEEYLMSGQRLTRIDKYLGADDLKIYNYETSLYPFPKDHGLGFNTFMEAESNMLKFFYLIKHDISPESVDCDEKIIKAIPLLEERGFISRKNGKIELLATCLTHEQEKSFWNICTKASKTFSEKIEKPLAEYKKTHRKTIPSHLKSVPVQKLTMPYGPASMMFVYGAINQGIHPRDLGYPCPETIIVCD